MGNNCKLCGGRGNIRNLPDFLEKWFFFGGFESTLGLCFFLVFVVSCLALAPRLDLWILLLVIATMALALGLIVWILFRRAGIKCWKCNGTGLMGVAHNKRGEGTP